MRIRTMGAELFHYDKRTERQTDRHDEAFRNFTNAPKNRSIHKHTKISLGRCKTTRI